jgi:hypothetical protein
MELLLDEVFDEPFDMFEALASWYENRGIEMLNLSRNSRYEELLEFGRKVLGGSEDKLMEALCFDYYARENVKSRPAFLGEDKVEKEFADELVVKVYENVLKEYLQ